MGYLTNERNQVRKAVCDITTTGGGAGTGQIPYLEAEILAIGLVVGGTDVTQADVAITETNKCQETILNKTNMANKAKYHVRKETVTSNGTATGIYEPIAVSDTLSIVVTTKNAGGVGTNGTATIIVWYR